MFVEPEEHLIKRSRKSARLYRGMERIPVMIFEKGISVELIKRRDDVGFGEAVLRDSFPTIANLLKGEKNMWEVHYIFVPYSKITKVTRIRTITFNVWTFTSTEGPFMVDATIPGIKPWMEWIENNVELRKLHEMRSEIDKM